MALTKCPDCGTEISTEAPTCPKCGRPNTPQKKKPSAIRTGCGLFVLAGLVIGVIAAISSGGGADDSSSSSDTPAPQVAPYETTARALYAAYNQNEVATQDAIGQRPIQVTGVIASIDEDFSGSPVLHLEDGNEFSQLGLTLAGSEHDKAASLQKGMRVVAICHKMTRIVDSPQGGDCYLVSNGE